MDQSNPAVQQHTRITPLLLEAVAEDPSIIQGIAAKMTLVQMDAVHVSMDSPNITVAQRLATLELMAKIGQIGAYSKAAQQNNTGNGNNFSVNIVIEPNAKRQSITVDTTTKEVPLSVETKELASGGN